MDVFFYEAFAEEEEALKRHLPEGCEAGFTSLTVQESGHGSPPARLISIRTQSLIPPGWTRDLQGILSRSTGYDHVLAFLLESGPRMKAGYLPLYCSRAVAEQALMFWLGLMRKIRVQMIHMQDFQRDGITGIECAGRTLLVVGVGNIGSEICRIGEALGMEVLGVDIVMRHEGVRYVSLHDALPRSDVICCAMNLTVQNRGYFSYEILRQAKPGAIFVNIARGELSPAGDLLRLLEEGHLAGVGLDVYENEAELAPMLRAGTVPGDPSMQAVCALMRNDRAILTPHNAFNTQESVERKASQSMRQVERFLSHGEFLWPVEGA